MLDEKESSKTKMDWVKVMRVYFVMTLMVMSVTPQPIEGITSSSLPAFIVNLCQAFAELFLQLMRNLDFSYQEKTVTTTLNNSAIMKICGNGESEQHNFETFGVNCSSKF